MRQDLHGGRDDNENGICEMLKQLKKIKKIVKQKYKRLKVIFLINKKYIIIRCHTS